MLLTRQCRMFGIVFDLFESFLDGREGVKSTLPDDGVGGFAAGYWSQALTSREDAAMLQFSELLLEGVDLLFVGWEVLLNKT